MSLKEEEWRAALEKIICFQMKAQKRDRISLILAMEENLKGKRRLELSTLADIQTRIDILRDMRLIAEKEIGGGDKI